MSKRNAYRWAAQVETLRRNRGRWMLLLPDVPVSAVRIVRERRHPDLRLDGEVVRVSARNVYVTRDGQRRCDLYLKLEEVAPPV